MAHREKCNSRFSWATVRAVQNRGAIDNDPTLWTNACAALGHRSLFDELHTIKAPGVSSIDAAVLLIAIVASKIVSGAKESGIRVKPTVVKRDRAFASVETPISGSSLPVCQMPDANQIQPLLSHVACHSTCPLAPRHASDSRPVRFSGQRLDAPINLGGGTSR